jgi:sn-glycerol 3-phosphate transport system ATP-binding protein
MVSHDGRPARVRSVEHLGADSIVICEMDGQSITVRQPGFSKAAGDDDIRLSWAEADEHHFDKKTGRRLATTGYARQAANR